MPIEIREMTEKDMDDVARSLEIQAVMRCFKNYDEFCEFTRDAYKGLMKFGGSFAHALGELLFYADSANTFKIYDTWTDDLKHHADLVRQYHKNHSA